jgi:hypothetical protein
MIQEYIEVPNRKWGIVVVLDFDVDEDYDELMAQFQSFGMTNKNAKRALDILFNYNTGMAISNDELRMSAIYISKATTPSEFWNTCIHELVHVSDAIVDYYGVEWGSESSAYLVGYLTKELVERIGEPCK